MTLGGCVSRSTRVQNRSGRFAACARKAMDVLPESSAELLNTRRLTLLLQPPAFHQSHHPHARQGYHPRCLLHTLQQVGHSLYVQTLTKTFSRQQSRNKKRTTHNAYCAQKWKKLVEITSFYLIGWLPVSRSQGALVFISLLLRKVVFASF